MPRAKTRKRFDVLTDLLRNHPHATGAEIGVRKGDTAARLLQRLPGIKKYYCVDPWEDYPGHAGGSVQSIIKGLAKDHRRFRKVARDKFPDKVVELQMMSADAARHIPDESLDFIFIDGNHAYDYVREDIAAWAPKVKPFGLIAGHDYNYPPHPEWGVSQAVGEAFGDRVRIGDEWTWYLWNIEDCSQLTVCYGITPINIWRRMAMASVYSLLKYNPGARVHVTEEHTDYHWAIKPASLVEDPPGPVLFLDADTTITGSLVPVLDTDADLCIRKHAGWDMSKRLRRTWNKSARALGIKGCSTYYNSGVLLCQQGIAGELKERWLGWVEKIFALRKAGDARIHFSPWLAEQHALSLAIAEADWTVEEWGSSVHTYAMREEKGGLILHHGSSRWRDPFIPGSRPCRKLMRGNKKMGWPE